MRDTILMTCGTSLIGNAGRAIGKELASSPDSLLRWLRTLDVSDKSCGAEINGLACMIEELPDTLDPIEVILYVSDTDDGILVGKVLETVIPEKFDVSKVKLVRIEGLNPKHPDTFRRRGLRNLVMRLADDVKQKGRPRCIINATGGFKVEVGLAQELASAVGIPSYYKFEFSSKGMLVPPMPVGLDIGLWLRLNKSMESLENEPLRKRDLDKLMEPICDEHDRERFLMLLEDVPLEKGDRLYDISALGELFRVLARNAFWEREVDFMPPPVSPDEKAEKVQHSNSEEHLLHFEARHGIGEKLLEIPFVSKVRSHYYKKSGWTMNRCHVKDRSEKELEVEWGNDMGLIKYILTVPKARGEEQLQAASLHISEKLKTL
ncbi:CRISPR-associated protein, APE2256 family [Dethiosulfovibrio peptidovorans DSM 11002]|uniref:CRISPR-associated protein, APE2256 family n=1 Tax=Dethiosulfovibrio peptidovorans DSM 11002 TaxID=469381 RepID=D2Z4J6_9BACT|nr:putative CRISPR-associated protein [Dethiosulfovibrio peptidovorans]EFC90525.1 CRISPR-associated protein, APE2256 family [Dethiosulfovibrio peptidovorans DSM 11002]